MRKLALEELERHEYEEYHQKSKLPIVVVLDNIRSMYNVGAVFRTCDALLVKRLFLCGITAHPPHREIQKTAIGSTESVNWTSRNSAQEAAKELKNEGYKIIGVEQTNESKALSQFTPIIDQKYALIMGNEVEGLSDEVLKELDLALEIPQFGTKHSFNIAVSSGITIWHFAKPYIDQKGMIPGRLM